MTAFMLGHVVFAVSYCSIGWHLWAKRETLRKDLGVARAFFSKILVELFGLLPFMPFVGVATERAADEEWVQKHIDELRLQHAQSAAQIGSVALGTTLVALSISWKSSSDPFVRETIPQVTGALVVTYILLLSITVGNVGLTRFRLKAVYVLVNLLFCLRILTASASPYFYTLQGARFVFRTILGMLVLDLRLSFAMNFLWTVVLIRHQVVKINKMAPSTGTSDLTTVVGVEVWTLIICQTLLLIIHRFVESHIRLNLGMFVARSVQKAVRRLLSVLCDAELHLTPNLEIQEPSNKVAHLLAPDKGNAGVATIEERSFIDFIAEADQGRFQSFMSNSCGAAGTDAGPAASIHLHLRDTTGWSFPVEIFHAKLPYSESSSRQPDHLIGIRESGLICKEASASVDPQGPTHGPGPLMPAELPPAPLPKVAAPAQGDTIQDAAIESPAPLGSLCSPQQLSSGIFAQEFNNLNALRPDDSASVQSARTHHSYRPLEGLELPVLSEMQLHIDVLEKDLAVKEIRVCFKGKGNTDTPQEPPVLREWIHESIFEELQTWVQKNLNTVMNGDQPSKPFGPVLLQWPSGGGEGEELFLEASNLKIGILEPEDEDSSDDSGEEREDEKGEEGEDGEKEDEEEDSDSDEGPDELLAVLTLQNFKQYIVPPSRPQPHRPRSHRSHKPGSNRSHRSHGRPVQQLPAIEEAKAGQKAGSNSDSSKHSSKHDEPGVASGKATGEEATLGPLDEEEAHCKDHSPEGAGQASATASHLSSTGEDSSSPPGGEEGYTGSPSGEEGYTGHSSPSSGAECWSP